MIVELPWINNLKALIGEWSITPDDCAYLQVKVPYKWAVDIQTAGFQVPVLFANQDGEIEFTVFDRIENDKPIYRRSLEVGL